MIEAVRQWQTRLLQLDRRNALLYFAMGKRGVTIQGFEPDAFLERLTASRSGLAFKYAERVRASSGEIFTVPPATEDQVPEPQVRVRPGDLETDLAPLELQKRLGALSKRDREWEEEQGLNVLFIALGFLRWVDEDQEHACSPILLVPCDLTRESPRDPYVLAEEESDDPVVNPTLRHKLASTTGIALPEFGEGHFFAREWAAAADAARRASLANPRFSVPVYLLAAALTRLGRIGEAQSVSARLLELQPGFTVSGMVAGYAERTEHMASLGAALRELGLPE